MIKKKENKIEIKKRPPVVVVLGHIDHGKTSLLMAIKDFRTLGKEAGGITQHVGAYQIEYNKEKITFLDTPGHESFSAIRSRGAKAADIGLLVIDACEGIKKQTKEAIKHIKESGVSPIVVLNKMDKPNANPEKVKQQLLEEDLWVESLGGKIPSVEISAKTKEGINDLLEVILLVAEMEQIEALVGARGEGTIIESRIDTHRGPTATVLVTQGILKSGDIIGTSSVVGKVKTLESFEGKILKEAEVGDPVSISGFTEVPSVGEILTVYNSLAEASKEVKGRNIQIQNPIIKEGDKVLNLVIKTDVIGSLEGILDLLKGIPQEQVKINILKAEVGDVNEKDVKLSRDSDAHLISFRVKTEKIAESVAQNSKVDLCFFDIIYELAMKVRELMDAILVVEKKRTDIGELDVLAIFRTEKDRQIVGGRVMDGRVEKGLKLEIFRDNQKIGEGKVMGIEANKKKVDVVHKDNEAGILYLGKERIQEGDVLKFYKEEFIKPTISNV